MNRGKALLEAWKHPVGTPVIVRLDSGEERETITRSEPWLVGDDRPVILLGGMSGGYALERVRPVSEGRCTVNPHDEERLALDTIVRRGLGVHRGTTIEERARAVLRDAVASPARDAALAILGPGEPWDRMRRAARALRPRMVQP